MRIAIDLDGVCYEFQRTYRYMLNEYRNLDLPPVDDWWKYWEADEEYIGQQDRDWMWSEGVKLGLFRYGHVTRGAIVGLLALRNAGHDLVVVSHRPASAVPDTLAWLSYINIPWSEVHILSNGEAKSTVSADILVDDKVENVVEWRDAGREAILYDKPYNSNYIWEERAEDWREVCTWVATLSM